MSDMGFSGFRLEDECNERLLVYNLFNSISVISADKGKDNIR